MSSEPTDVVIAGAGPVGLFTVFACGMLGLRCQLVDILDQAGGQCAALYPDKPIYDIPGYPVIQAGRLVEQLRCQATPFAPVYHFGEKAESLEQLADHSWKVTTSTGLRIKGRAVIIAAGVGALEPNRPPLPRIEEYEGKSVFYLVTRSWDFADKRVVIAGGGDSAVDWAIALAPVAKQVMLVHRRERFRAAVASVDQLHRHVAAGLVELVIPYQLAGLAGADGQLTRVGVVTLEGRQRWLEADVLLPFFGLQMKLGPIANWGVELHNQRIPVTPDNSATNLPGVFAVGDVATYPGKLKLISSGFTEANQAAHAIYPLVFPGQPLHFEYSTTKGIPGL